MQDCHLTYLRSRVPLLHVVSDALPLRPPLLADPCLLRVDEAMVLHVGGGDANRAALSARGLGQGY